MKRSTNYYAIAALFISSLTFFGNMHGNAKREKSTKNEISQDLLDYLKTRQDLDPETVQKMIDNGADVNSIDEDGNTSLCIAILIYDCQMWDTKIPEIMFQVGHTKIAEILIKNGANINVQNIAGCTPLMFAAAIGNNMITKMLIENGANIHLVDEDGKTALFYAITFGEDNNLKTAEILIENGANINVQDNNGDTPLLCIIKQNPDLFTQKEFARMFLIVDTLKKNNIDLDLSMIDNNEKIKQYNEKSKNYICITKKIVKMLIQNGANVNIKDNDGNTSLMLAAYRTHFKDYLAIIKILIQSGANLLMTNNEGYTALAIAVKNNHHKIAELLR